jgi:hypothetical protein
VVGIVIHAESSKQRESTASGRYAASTVSNGLPGDIGLDEPNNVA